MQCVTVKKEHELVSNRWFCNICDKKEMDVRYAQVVGALLLYHLAPSAGVDCVLYCISTIAPPNSHLPNTIGFTNQEQDDHGTTNTGIKSGSMLDFTPTQSK